MNTKLNHPSQRPPVQFSLFCIEINLFKTGLFLWVVFLTGVLLVSCGANTSTNSSTSTSSSTTDDQNAAATVLLGFCQALKQGNLQTAKQLFSALGNHYTREAFTALTYDVLAHEAQTSRIASCRVDSVVISTMQLTKQGEETALGTITYTMANGRVLKLVQPMEKIKGMWKVKRMETTASP